MKFFLIAFSVFVLTTAFTKLSIVSSTQGNPPAYQPLKSFKGDTLAYIQANFIKNKAAYVNQPLSKLAGVCEVPFKAYSADIVPKAKFSQVFYLMTRNANDIYARTAHKKNPFTLIIHWANDVPADQATKLSKQDYGVWKGASKAYYQQQVVKDIALVNYGF